MPKRKVKTVEVVPSPIKDKLPRIIGGRCEYSGGVWNDEAECPWFAGLHFNDEGERRPDNYTGDLSHVQKKMIEKGLIKIKTVKKAAPKKKEVVVEEPAKEELADVV